MPRLALHLRVRDDLGDLTRIAIQLLALLGQSQLLLVFLGTWHLVTLPGEIWSHETQGAWGGMHHVYYGESCICLGKGFMIKID